MIHGKCNYRKAAIVLLLAVIFVSAGRGLLAAAATAESGGNLPDDLFAVSFPTLRDGWACGRWGIILRSSDGGASWDFQDSGTDYTLLGIDFADEKNGWAVGEDGIILHTSDGGKTWRVQQSPVDFYLMDVDFVNQLEGWIVTERTHILHTNDGGKHWTVQFSDEDYILKSVSFADQRNGWAVGEYGHIYYTSDAGKTWSKQAGYFGISPETGYPDGESMLFDVMAVDATTAWAVGIDGKVVHTMDGGKTWRPRPGAESSSLLFCVAGDGSGALVVGGKAIGLTSADDGKNWREIQYHPSFDFGWTYDAAHVGGSLFVSVGRGGAIYKGSLTGQWLRAEYRNLPLKGLEKK